MTDIELETCRTEILEECMENEEDCSISLNNWEEIANFLMNQIGTDDGENTLKLLKRCERFEDLHKIIGDERQIQFFESEHDRDALVDFEDISQINNRFSAFYLINLIAVKYFLHADDITDLKETNRSIPELCQILTAKISADNISQECSDCGESPANFFEQITIFLTGSCWKCSNHQTD